MTFDIKNKRVIVDVHTLMIGQLRSIYEKLEEDVAIRALTYIYVGSQIHSDAPFFSARRDEVQELAWNNSLYGAPQDVKNLLTRHKDKFTDVIEPYKKAYSTPEVRMLNTFNHQIDELKDLMDKTKPEIAKSTHPTSGVVSFAHNTDAINKVMISLGSLMDTKDKIEAKMRKEAAGRVRAGKKPSRLEKKHAANA
jgi:hypothetical protein